MLTPTTLCAGVDIAKNTPDAAIHGRRLTFPVANDPTGWNSLAAHFAQAGVTRVGIEATGGYERPVRRALEQAGFTVVLLQPLQVKAFAQIRRQRAKSDRLDAQLIAACVQALDAQDRMPPIPGSTI